MIIVNVNKVDAKLTMPETLTSGMVGKKIQFVLSSDFDGLYTTAVFTNGTTTKDVLLSSDTTEIPHEVLELGSKPVTVGIHATNGSTLVIPTIMCYLGRVKDGADPSGDESTDPTLPVWAQIQAQMKDINAHIINTKNPHKVTKSQVGLGNVDNTSDLDKPVSKATQTELDKKFNSTGGKVDGDVSADNVSAIKISAMTFEAASLQAGSVSGVDGKPLTISNLAEPTSDNDAVPKKYVDENGGKIDKIKVNNVEQKITEKAVDIAVPTKTSQLENDSHFVNKTYVDNGLNEKIPKSGGTFEGNVDCWGNISAMGMKCAGNPVDESGVVNKGYLDTQLTKNYELIEEISITADTVSIVRSAEPDGTPYNFKKLRVLGLCNGITPSTSNQGWMKINNGKIFANLEGVFETSQTTSISIVDVQNIENTWSVEVYRVPRTHATSYNDQMRYTGFAKSLFDSDHIKDFNWYGASLKAGMKVKVYGVRV